MSFVGFSLMLIGRLEQFAGFISGLFFQTNSLRNFFDVLGYEARDRERSGRGRSGPRARRGRVR